MCAPVEMAVCWGLKQEASLSFASVGEADVDFLVYSSKTAGEAA